MYITIDWAYDARNQPSQDIAVIARLDDADGTANAARYWAQYTVYRAYCAGVEYNDARNEVVFVMWSNILLEGWQTILLALDPNTLLRNEIYQLDETTQYVRRT